MLNFFDPNVKVRIFQATIKANGEIDRYCKSIQFHT